MRTCEIEGCAAPHRARGLCSTHYNQRLQPRRHRKVAVACGWCGRLCDKQPDRMRGYAERFCSLSCRDTWRQRSKLPVPFVGLVVRYCDIPVPPRQRAPHVFVGGMCARCGSSYLAEDYTNTARYCSVACYRSDSKARRRAVKKGAFVAPVSRLKVFERDGWRCQICRKKVNRTKVVPHPKAPVLDHIVPLAKGGTHEPANVQCAHYLCNSIKSDSLGDVQLALIG